MPGKLEGRRIVITGTSRGVGLETARLFLREGASVLGVARDAGRLADVTPMLASLGDFASLRADLVEPGAPDKIAAAVAERWGALDVLFNNAAILVKTGEPPTFEGEPAGTLETTLANNLLAPFRLSMAVLPMLRRGREPRIVHVGSGAGTLEGVHLDGIASYRLSKWALNGLTMLQATHLQGQIAVNAFDPGWVKTDLGGPKAPGSPVDSADGALAVTTLPFETTGKFWKDGREIPF
jgi:NAD(P)-dependent dehydrogenase (short-subunit alcohol dehydrogenase family)